MSQLFEREVKEQQALVLAVPLRDYFAAHAPAEVLNIFCHDTECNPPDDPFPKKGNGWDYLLWRMRRECAARYAYADAMLKVRSDDAHGRFQTKEA